MKSFLKGLILLLLCSLNIHAKEKDKNDRILSFDQQIKITPEGKLQVHELITIYNGENDNLNNSIKRGLVRDFPTTYINSFGLISKVPFELKSVERDGEKEDYHLEQVSNGIRMYLGLVVTISCRKVIIPIISNMKQANNSFFMKIKMSFIGM